MDFIVNIHIIIFYTLFNVFRSNFNGISCMNILTEVSCFQNIIAFFTEFKHYTHTHINNFNEFWDKQRNANILLLIFWILSNYIWRKVITIEHLCYRFTYSFFDTVHLLYCIDIVINSKRNFHWKQFPNESFTSDEKIVYCHLFMHTARKKAVLINSIISPYER